jgi:hypothetical protein
MLRILGAFVAVLCGAACGQAAVLPHLSPSLDAVTRVETLEAAHPAFDGPTTGAIVGSSIFLIANSQLWEPREPAETIVLETPL